MKSLSFDSRLFYLDRQVDVILIVDKEVNPLPVLLSNIRE